MRTVKIYIFVSVLFNLILIVTMKVNEVATVLYIGHYKLKFSSIIVS